MNKTNFPVEYIVWTDIHDGHNRKVFASGFVIAENKDKLSLALTKSYGDYIDIEEIEVGKIIERRNLKL